MYTRKNFANFETYLVNTIFFVSQCCYLLFSFILIDTLITDHKFFVLLYYCSMYEIINFHIHMPHHLFASNEILKKKCIMRFKTHSIKKPLFFTLFFLCMWNEYEIMLIKHLGLFNIHTNTHTHQEKIGLSKEATKKLENK